MSFCAGVVTRRLAAMIYTLRRLLEFCLVPSVLTFCMYNLCRLQASIKRCREMGHCQLLSLSCYMCHSHSIHHITVLNYITSTVDVTLWNNRNTVILSAHSSVRAKSKMRSFNLHKAAGDLITKTGNKKIWNFANTCFVQFIHKCYSEICCIMESTAYSFEQNIWELQLI